jgi:hypothetical protein
MLDFLLVYSPMHSQQFSFVDMKRIINCVLRLLLKRDMSLNRRIYDWLFASEHTDSKQSNDNHLDNATSYFQVYTREILIETIEDALKTITCSAVGDVNSSTTISTWNLTKLIRMLLVLGEFERYRLFIG